MTHTSLHRHSPSFIAEARLCFQQSGPNEGAQKANVEQMPPELVQELQALVKRLNIPEQGNRNLDISGLRGEMVRLGANNPSVQRIMKVINDQLRLVIQSLNAIGPSITLDSLPSLINIAANEASIVPIFIQRIQAFLPPESIQNQQEKKKKEIQETLELATARRGLLDLKRLVEEDRKQQSQNKENAEERKKRLEQIAAQMATVSRALEALRGTEGFNVLFQEFRGSNANLTPDAFLKQFTASILDNPEALNQLAAALDLRPGQDSLFIDARITVGAARVQENIRKFVGNIVQNPGFRNGLSRLGTMLGTQITITPEMIQSTANGLFELIRDAIAMKLATLDFGMLESTGIANRARSLAQQLHLSSALDIERRRMSLPANATLQQLQITPAVEKKWSELYADWSATIRTAVRANPAAQIPTPTFEMAKEPEKEKQYRQLLAKFAAPIGSPNTPPSNPNTQRDIGGLIFPPNVTELSVDQSINSRLLNHSDKQWKFDRLGDNDFGIQQAAGTPPDSRRYIFHLSAEQRATGLTLRAPQGTSNPGDIEIVIAAGTTVRFTTLSTLKNSIEADRNTNAANRHTKIEIRSDRSAVTLA